MSKRSSVGTPNTLFKYFSKTPPANKKTKLNEKNNTTKEDELRLENNKRERSATLSPETNIKHNSDSEEDVPLIKKRKRIRLNPVDSDDSDVENKVHIQVEQPKAKLSFEQKVQNSIKASPKNEKKTNITNKRSINTSIKIEDSQEKDLTSAEGSWLHCKLEWLKPEKIRDGQRRRPDHPDYDPSTLYVPEEFYKSQTPAHKQWWKMKSTHYDCVLFFKVGKFYELYHMDAAVGVNELAFSYMKGEFAHSGFPESAYTRSSDTLVSKGYKVARVEQTETPDMMAERCRKSNQIKCDKVVTREICQVTVRGTQVCSPLDSGPTESTSNYLMAVAEEDKNGSSSYGVCFVDTSIGLFRLGQFRDDKHSSRLLTTFAHYPPALIVYDRKSTTARSKALLNAHCTGARLEPRVLPAAEPTLRLLAERYYRCDDGDWPEGIKPFLHEGDALGLTPADNCELAVKALGGCVVYLTECLLDIQVLGMSQFTTYEPPDLIKSSQGTAGQWEGGNTMVLDSITLRNLRIIQDEGCLYSKLNFCATPMGKRLLYQWVCAPSCNLIVINERQQAVKELYDNKELCLDAKSILETLPDLERLLAKIHALGNLKKSKQHPDSRAIFYEDKIYSKRKVLDFISILNGFTTALKLSDVFSNTKSELLQRVTRLTPEGLFPDYRDTLKFFKEAFNQTDAEKEGKLLPKSGVDQEYDNTLQLINDIEQDLKEYLSEQEKYFKCRLNYVGTDKKRYQLEMPQSAASRVTTDYHLEGARKGFKRYSTAKTKELLSRMQSAEEQKSHVLKDLSRRIFEKFSQHQRAWSAAVASVSAVDALLALAEAGRSFSGEVCLPQLTYTQDKPYVNIVEGRHPCIPIVEEFIPNDTVLGGPRPPLLLLTGPNMGGKSTLMRQVGLLTVLAHLGSFVPAQECSMSVVDRIFTRLGASDDILSGQSTFLVEMSETAAIVKHATVHSLLLIDELGRGTSTYDGTALASGVCAALAARGARALFSTHYHALVHHLRLHNLQLGHMACMVETDESTPDNDENIPEETITFLYKLTPGACPKSYGFNAARLAGVPKEITSRAHQISRRLEKEAASVRAFRSIFKESNPADIRELLAALNI